MPRTAHTLSNLLLAGVALVATAFAQTQTPIDCGVLATGSFRQGPIDSFNFTALPGDVILVRATSTASDPAIPFTPRFSVINPSSNAVAARPPVQFTGSGATRGATFVGEFELGNGGPYQIRVQNDTPAASGSFTVLYTLVNRSCAQTSLQCGQGVTGQINTLLQVNSYQFAAGAGDRLSLRITKFAPATAGSGIVAYVYTPAGQLIMSDSNSPVAISIGVTGSGLIDFTSPVTGVLNVIVFDRAAIAGAANYAISMFRLNGPCANPNSELTCNAVQEAAITSALGVDTYSVSVGAGETVSIRTALLATGAFAPVVEVYDPVSAAVPLAVSRLSEARAITSYMFTGKTGGAYTVLVRDGGTGRNIGGYAITLQRINRPCNAAAVVCGSIVDGSITGLLRANVYTLPADADDLFLLRLLHNDQNPSFRPRIEIYSPQGSTIETLSVTDLGRLVFRAPTGGVYTLLVTDSFDNSQTGTYSFSLQRVNRPCNAVTLSCGGVAAAGSLTRALASSTYIYNAAAGESFSVRLLDQSGTLQPNIDVFDPQGRPAGIAVSGNFTGIDVAQPTGGTYTIVATDGNRRPVGGSYRLALLRTSNPCAPSPPQGQTTGGVVTGPAPFTAYSLVVNAGDVLVLRSASFTPGLTAQMELYDPAGQRLESQTFRIARTAAVSGNYTVIIGASGPRTGGAYSFGWQLVNRPAGTIPLPCGATTTASLVAANQFRYYSANAASGDLLRLIFTRTPENFSPQIELYDPSGARLSTMSDISQRAAANGDYLVVVSPASSSGETGSFAVAYQRPNRPCDPVALTCGQTTLRQVGIPGQLDTFTFNGAGGNRINLQLGQRTGSYAPFAELYDAAGNRLTSSSTGSLVATLAAGGAYTVLVRDRASVGLGSYRVSLQNETNACPVDDKESPMLTLIQPTGGEVIAGASSFQIQWLSDDNAAVTAHEVALSTDGGNTFAAPIAAGLSGNAQSYTWPVPSDIAPSRTAAIRVTARDAAGNVQSAASGPLSIIGSGFTPNSTTTLTYDSLNRVTQAVFSDGKRIEYTWDAAGNLLEVRVVTP